MKKYLLLASLLALLLSGFTVYAAPWSYTGDYVPGMYKYVPPANDYVPTYAPIINGVPTRMPGIEQYNFPNSAYAPTYTPPVYRAPAYVPPSLIGTPVGNIIPPAPLSLTASCPAPGTMAQVSWTPVSGATFYTLRLDNKADGWTGSCTSANGDFCVTTASTSYSFNAAPNSQWKLWVHACNASGCSVATYGNDFMCNSGAMPNPPRVTYGTCTGRIDARICALRTSTTTFSSPSEQARACLSVQQRSCIAQGGSFHSPYCKRETIFTHNGCAVVTKCPWTCTSY